MTDRILKSLLTAMLGVMALLYMAHNLYNLPQAYGALDYVLGLQEHKAYPNNLLPALGPPLSRFAAWLVFAGEAVAAGLLLWGAWRLWTARSFAASEHHMAAARIAKWGAAAAIVVWFGLFTTIGGAGYQMWQTDLGSGSLGDAFTFWVFAFLLLLYLGRPEEA